MFINQIQTIAEQIRDILAQLPDDDYSRPLTIFNGSSIGQHCRHLIEFFTELENGYALGRVNYENRARNRELETSRVAAMQALQELMRIVPKPDRALYLIMHPESDSSLPLEAQSSYYRELAFVVEHAVHHMALIRIAVERRGEINVPDHFGIAYSTQRFRSSGKQ